MSTIFISLIQILLLCSASNDDDDDGITLELLDQLQVDVRARIDSFARPDDGTDTRPLLPTLIRLAFHDCGGLDYDDDSTEGVCNGCINPYDSSHAGLEYGAVYPMEQVYRNQDNITVPKGDGSVVYDVPDTGYVWSNPSGISWDEWFGRADFWAISATMALEYGVEVSYNLNPIDHLDKTGLPYPATWNEVVTGNIKYYYGRDEIGCASESPFNEDTEDDRFTVNVHWTHTALFDFFDERFDMDIYDVIALMGAHKLGKGHQFVSKDNLTASATDGTKCCDGSGFRGPWVRGPREALNNGFYSQMSLYHQKAAALFIQAAPCFDGNICRERHFVEEEALEWRFKLLSDYPIGNSGSTLAGFHLNVDMGLYLDIEQYADKNATNGKINCQHPLTAFDDEYSDNTPICPRLLGENYEIKEQVDDYIMDNRKWLRDFWDAWVKMITIGYDIDDLDYVERDNDDCDDDDDDDDDDEDED